MTRKFEFYIPLSVLIIGTIASHLTDIDLELASRFYDPISRGGFLEEHPLVTFGNQWGPKVSMTFALLAFIGISFSFANPKLIKHRAVLYFIAFSYVLGPALLVNGILKETFNRPRPREIVEFRGNYDHKKVLVPGSKDFHGKSFPSGHGSAGFVLVFFYFLLKKRSKRLSWLALLLSLSFGVYLSIVRMASGAHFFSDNLWAFAICWFVSYFLYYRWYLAYVEKPRSEFKSSRKRWIFLAGGASGLILFVFLPFLLSDEFHQEYKNIRISIPKGIKRIVISGTIKRGNAKLYLPQDKSKGDIVIYSYTKGRGFPGIGISREYQIENKDNTLYLDLQVKPSGYYLRYQSHNQIWIPKEYAVTWDLKVPNGIIIFKRGYDVLNGD